MKHSTLIFLLIVLTSVLPLSAQNADKRQYINSPCLTHSSVSGSYKYSVSTLSGKPLTAPAISYSATQNVANPLNDNIFHRTKAQKAVKTSTDILLVALPAAALAGTLIEHDWTGLKQLMLSEGTQLAAMLILKLCVNERRPDGSNHHSFPSGHTSTTFSAATFLQMRYGWKVGVPAFVVASYVGWGRVYAKRHHWWDVVAGAAIGAGASLIYTRPFAKTHDLSLQPIATPSGLALSASLTL